MEDAQALLGPALERAPIEITLVGDISVERAVEITASTFGALPSRDETWPAYEENAQIAFPAPTAEPEIVRFNGEPNQGMANIYYPAGDGFDPQRRAAMDLLESVFRLKALDRFRERDGATYSPIISAQLSRVFPDYGFIWVGLDVDVNDVPAMYGVTDEVAATLAAGEISEDELQRARQPILEQIEESRERNPFWVNALSRSQTDPQRLEDIRTTQARYEAVTVEDLAALAAEVLRADAAYRVSILPEGVEPQSD
jgi:Predicted Zn-dependent peptidases